MLSGFEFALAGLAALAAGFINALAGGGTLISFPALIALGVPGVAANVTNTVALCPGYFGGSIAQRGDLRGQAKRLWFLIPAGIIGGIIGSMLLLVINADIFRLVVPFLILFASALLAVQSKVREWINRRARNISKKEGTVATVLPVGVAAVYGGYFGAGLSVIILAVLGLLFDDTLTRLNALKQCISLATNVAAAVVFIFSGSVIWPLAACNGRRGFGGGAAGGKVAGQVNADMLRWIIVVIGLAVGSVLLVQLF